MLLSHAIYVPVFKNSLLPMVCDFNAAEICNSLRAEGTRVGAACVGLLFYCSNALCLALFRLGLFLKETGRSVRSWRISAVQGRFYTWTKYL